MPLEVQLITLCCGYWYYYGNHSDFSTLLRETSTIQSPIRNQRGVLCCVFSYDDERLILPLFVIFTHVTIALIFRVLRLAGPLLLNDIITRAQHSPWELHDYRTNIVFRTFVK